MKSIFDTQATTCSDDNSWAVIVIGNQKFTCGNYDKCDGVHEWKGDIDEREVMIRWK